MKKVYKKYRYPKTEERISAKDLLIKMVASIEKEIEGYYHVSDKILFLSLPSGQHFTFCIHEVSD